MREHEAKDHFRGVTKMIEQSDHVGLIERLRDITTPEHSDVTLMREAANCIEQLAALSTPPAVPTKGWREFIEDVATQQPEKPDHWSSCGQCERNIDRAQEVLSGGFLQHHNHRRSSRNEPTPTRFDDAAGSGCLCR